MAYLQIKFEDNGFSLFRDIKGDPECKSRADFE